MKGSIIMFVCSFRSSFVKRAVVGLLAVGAVIAAVILVCTEPQKPTEAAAKSDMQLTYKAGDNAERLAFISQFGWDVPDEPLEVREVKIPEEFDDTYEKYNAIQLAQGLDLSEYCGKRVKRWTYVINNYPDMPENDGTVRINMLVYKNSVIGGDVCSIKLDGFMHGFMKE